MRNIGWLFILGLVVVAWYFGIFDTVADYFVKSAEESREVGVVHNEDGSITTIKYKTIFDLWFPENK